MIPRQTLKALATARAQKFACEARADACLAEAHRHIQQAALREREIDALLDEALHERITS